MAPRTVPRCGLEFDLAGSSRQDEKLCNVGCQSPLIVGETGADLAICKHRNLAGLKQRSSDSDQVVCGQSAAVVVILRSENGVVRRGFPQGVVWCFGLTSSPIPVIERRLYPVCLFWD
jgi:hypothetical protein